MTDVERLFVLSCVAVVGLPILVFVDGIILFTTWLNWRVVAAAQKWPSTAGTVTASYLKRLSSGANSRANFPTVEYSYQVGGQSFQNNRLYPGPSATGGTGMENVIARYPVGALVDVFYDPQNPANSALEKKNPNLTITITTLILINSGMCLTLPLLWWVMGLSN